MKIGTKSVLFGAHCFFIHPWFVLIAWWKLYGFPWDPRYWIAFFVHDLGYWGKPNMDGPEGETHVEFGARIMGFLFDRQSIYLSYRTDKHYYSNGKRMCLTVGSLIDINGTSGKWADFSRYHSRFYAKKDGVKPSRLCIADKFAIYMEPTWLYLPRVNWSGEIYEYMKLAKSRSLDGENRNAFEDKKLSTGAKKDWHKAVQSYVYRWVQEHKDGRDDSWTPEAKKAIDINGVWQ